MTTTTQRELTLPIVDLSAATGSVEERAELLERLRTAAHDLGFFYVTGHGIPLEVQHDLFSATRAFFTLPEGTRREISNLRSPQFRGYTSLASEHTAGAATGHEPVEARSRSVVDDLGIADLCGQVRAEFCLTP